MPILQCVLEDKFGAQQTDAVDVERGGLFGFVRHRDVDVDLGGCHLSCHRHRCGDVCGLGTAGLLVLDAAGQHAAVGAVDGDNRAVLEVLGGGSGADDARHPEFAGNDGGVTGHAAGIGHQGRRPAHRGQPVRIGHLGHEDLAVLQTAAVGDVGEHPNDTGCRTGNCGQTLEQNLMLL